MIVVNSALYNKDLTNTHHHTLLITERLKDDCTRGTYPVQIKCRQYKCVCERCGKEYPRIVADIDLQISHYLGKQGEEYTNNIYCSACWSKPAGSKYPFAVSSFEWLVMKILRDYDIDYKAEFELPITGLGGGKLRIDFYIEHNNKHFAIECNGEQHDKPTDFAGGEAAFYRQKEHDARKAAYCKDNNIILISISYDRKDYKRIVTLFQHYGLI